VARQDQVDAAPDFPAVLRSFRAFLVEHKLIEKNGKRRIRFCWCSDGPWDIRDFVVKQCFISGQIPFPEWMTGDVLDVRTVVMAHTARSQTTGTQVRSSGNRFPFHTLLASDRPVTNSEHTGSALGAWPSLISWSTTQRYR